MGAPRAMLRMQRLRKVIAFALASRPRVREPKSGLLELPEIGGRTGGKIPRCAPALSPLGDRATLRCENA